MPGYVGGPERSFFQPLGGPVKQWVWCVCVCVCVFVRAVFKKRVCVCVCPGSVQETCAITQKM